MLPVGQPVENWIPTDEEDIKTIRNHPEIQLPVTDVLDHSKCKFFKEAIKHANVD